MPLTNESAPIQTEKGKIMNFNLKNLNLEDLELDVETIEITPAIDLSDFSDAQDLPETGASVGYNSCSHTALD
jgi:hypothetical protein